MASLFLAGNGLDIAHRIPTKYSDFRSFLVNLYPEAVDLKDDVVYLENCDDINTDEFAVEILLCVMDKLAGENWCDFEESLAYINFNSKLPLPNHRSHETDEEDQNLMQHYLRYIDMLTSGFINCAQIWQDFFRLWLKDIQAKIDRNEFLPRDTLRSLLSLPDMQFLTFNYTKTLQNLYGIRKVIHIHNRVGQNLIWGHGEDDISYNHSVNDSSIGPSIGSSFLDDMLMSFKKDTLAPQKKYSNFFVKLDRTIDKVYSYGFSYGKVDSVYIKKIVNSISPDAVWYFTTYEALDNKSIRIKKIKLRRYGFKGKFDTFAG